MRNGMVIVIGSVCPEKAGTGLSCAQAQPPSYTVITYYGGPHHETFTPYRDARRTSERFCEQRAFCPGL